MLTAVSPGIEIKVFCEPEELPIEGNALASGSDSADREAENDIRDQLEDGNDWAWCCAHVRVTYKGILTADSYLGACSYRDEADFRAGGYFDDMVSECLEEISSKRAALCAA